jgi:hypothetical protein
VYKIVSIFFITKQLPRRFTSIHRWCYDSMPTYKLPTVRTSQKLPTMFASVDSFLQYPAGVV